MIGSNLGENRDAAFTLALKSSRRGDVRAHGVLAPVSLLAQGQPPAHPPGQAAPVPPGPYKPVAIKMPPPLNDPSFDAFRKELAQVAKKKDRAALAKLVAAHFFWVPEEKDIADKSKPPIENLAKALSLDGADAFGWEALAAYAADGTAMPDPQRQRRDLRAGGAEFDEKAADELANATHTERRRLGLPDPGRHRGALGGKAGRAGGR